MTNRNRRRIQLNRGFKETVDSYFSRYYAQLEKTADWKIRQRKRGKSDANTLVASDVLAHAYLYLIERETDILDFADRHHKTVDIAVYSFAKKFISDSISFGNSKVKLESNRLFNRNTEKIMELDHILADDPEALDGQVESTSQTDDIYTQKFIDEFAATLDKQDGICFRVYYYDGIDSARDFAKHFDISLSSAYTTINGLKAKMKEYINKNKIH